MMSEHHHKYQFHGFGSAESPYWKKKEREDAERSRSEAEPRNAEQV